MDYKDAVINIASGTDGTVVAAVTGKKINVHGYVITTQLNTAIGTIRFENGLAGTALTGKIYTSGARNIIVPFSEVPWFSTGQNKLLNLENDNDSNITGHIIYSESE